MKDKQYKILCGITWILIPVSVAVIYLVHRAVPFMMDDLWYSTKLFADTPIRSLHDIVESQIWHYQNWGGRSITHGILQLTLLAGEQSADLLNVVMTLLLSWMICVITRERNVQAFFASMSMLLGLNANWKMSMFWQAGAANYLYITVFILVFLHCYLRLVPGESGQNIGDLQGKERHDFYGISIWIIPLGIIAGWSNENMGPAVWIISLIVILFLRRKKRKIRLWMILGNISCLAGSIMVIVAPGNFVRSAEAASNEYGVFWNCFLRCYAESKASLEYLFQTLLILVLMLLVSKGILNIPVGKKNLLLLLCALLSWGAMILSPHYPDRATFGTMVLLICVIISLTGSILRERKSLNLWFFVMTALIWLRGMFFLGEYLAICWGWIR